MTEQTLWTTVDCACGKPPKNADPRDVLEKDKSFSIGAALVESVAVLAARVDGLEYRLDQILGIVDAPLSPSEAIERLRQMRLELPDA